MRKSNQQSLGEVINQLLKNSPWGSKLRVNDLYNEWEKIAGKIISNHTKSLRLDEKGILYLELDSPALRNEIMLMRSELLKKIQEHSGNNEIKQITIL
jgi:predicted nucleic acid-binding Zn ribbon protein